jgi:hypothetical protein
MPVSDGRDKIHVILCRYVERVVSGAVTPNEERALGFPWSIELIRRSLASTG